MRHRKTLLVVGLALLVLGVFALVRTTLPASGAREDETHRAQQSAEERSSGGSNVPWAIASGLLLAAGATFIGIGMGSWRRPHAPVNEADFTGPGTLHDRKRPPPAV